MTSNSIVLPKDSNWKWPLRAFAFVIVLAGLAKWGYVITDFVAWLALPTWPWRDIIMMAFFVLGMGLMFMGAFNERRRGALAFAAVAFLIAYGLKP